jgi:hypothetical protein
MPILPSLKGTVAVKSTAEDFFPAFARRIEKGLFPGAPGWRSRYALVEQDPDAVRFQAVDWLTAINVGLNDVRLDMPESGTVRYRIRYPRWASYVVTICAAIGILLLAVLSAFDMRGYIATHPTSRVPGLTPERSVAVAWGIVIFWGFVWPWLLIALHKPALRRLITRLITETDAAASAFRAEQRPRNRP